MPMTNQKILITGGTGYLATAVLRLLKDVRCEIVRLGRPGARFPPVEGAAARISDISGDIADPGLWERVLEGINIVFHFAAQTSVPVAEREPWADFQINAAPALHLLETCRRKAWRPAVLFSSSVTVIGIPQSLPVNEGHPAEPITVYDLHKLMAEGYVKYYARRGIVSGAVLRLANVYGPGPRSGSPDRGILNRMVERAVGGQALTVYGSGEQIRDYVYIDDAARAFIDAAQNIERISGRHFVIGSGKGHTIAEAVTLISERAALKTGLRAAVTYVDPPQPAAPIEMRNFVADTSAFCQATGWQPRMSFPDGLDQTIEYCLRGERSAL